MLKRLCFEAEDLTPIVYMRLLCHHTLFAKEMKISARCHHKNLIEFIGAVPDHPAIIVIELKDCTLQLALTNGSVIPNHIHPISIDVAQGLVYLHAIQPIVCTSSAES